MTRLDRRDKGNTLAYFSLTKKKKFFLNYWHLVEEFSDEEPRDRSGSGSETDDEEDDHGDGEVGQSRNGSLRTKFLDLNLILRKWFAMKSLLMLQYCKVLLLPKPCLQILD